MFCPKREILRGKDGKISGCSRCPTGTDMFGTGARTEWELRSGTMWGHFTSSSAENLLISGFGCDSHAHNFGGSYVFTRRAGRLRLLKYDPALFMDQCRVFPFDDGRDFLVCNGEWGGQGEAESYVDSEVFDGSGKGTETVVFRTMDTTGTCDDDGSVVVKESAIKKVQYATKETGELSGVSVTATLGNVRCSQVGDTSKGETPPASLKTYEIEFTFDGKLFHVAPESRNALTLFAN